MARKDIGTLWDRNNRNSMNHNFKELYNVREMAIEKAVKDIKGEISDKITSTTQFIWQEPVDTREEIETAYPDPEVGYAVMVRETGKVYRYDDEGWGEVQDIDPTILNEVETRLDGRLDSYESEVDGKLSGMETDLKNKVNEEKYSADLADIQSKLPEVDKNKAKNLQFPLIIPHRGARHLHQEHTMEAYETQIERGNPLLEIDAQQLGNGSLVSMHDSTMDRTTDGNWTLDKLWPSYVRTRRVIDKVTDGPFGYVPEKIPFLKEIFQRFGVGATYVIESKDRKSARKIVDLAKDYKLQEYLIVQSFSLDDLKDIKDEDVPMLLMGNSMDGNQIEEAKNNNVTYLGCNKSSSDTYINRLIDSGLKTIVYTVNRRMDYDRLKDLGVQAVFSDDPWYIDRENFESKGNDYFRYKVFDDGMLDSGKSGATRGEFNTQDLQPYTWGFPNDPKTDDNRDFVIQGYLGELPDQFELTFEAHAETGSESGWLSVAVCLQNDFFDDDDTAKTGGGYHFLSSFSSGKLHGYKVLDDGAHKIDDVDPGDQDQDPTFKLTVTNSKIIFARTSAGAEVEITDSDFRNGFFAFGRKEARVMFENVKLKEI